MLSEKFSHILDKPLAPLARALSLNPNLVTVLGAVLVSLSAAVIPWNLFWGGMLIMLGSCLDLLDGILARVNNQATKFGAFLDSTLDRVADSFIFLGVAVHFMLLEQIPGAVITLLGMAASLLISYTRARAEALGVDCQVGLIERPERIIILIAGCLTKMILPAVMALTLLSWITVGQRILHVRSRLAENNQDHGSIPW